MVMEACRRRGYRWRGILPLFLHGAPKTRVEDVTGGEK